MDVKKFAGKVKRFRTMFRQNCPFSFHGPSSEAYKMIDEQEKKLQAVEKEAEDFHDLEELFELSRARIPNSSILGAKLFNKSSGT